MVYFVIKPSPDIPEHERRLMYQLRYKVTVKDWGWNIPTARKGLDKDQFDTDSTVYILVYDESDRMVACSRLNPTTQPHLMSDVFPERCEFSGVPCAADIMELSRFVVDKDHLTHNQQVQLYLQMCLAVTKYAVANHITRLTWLSEKSKYTKSVVVWRTRPLGLPHHYPDDDAEYIAAVMDTNEASIGRLRRFVKTDWSEILGHIPNREKARAA